MVKIRWRLREVMARYKITGEALAQELGVSAESISKWRTRETMPRISGDKVESLLTALTKLAGQTIVFADLYEESQLPSSQKPNVNFNVPIAL